MGGAGQRYDHLLFGTIHILDGRSDWFNDEVKEAFDASDEVQLEALLPDDDEAMLPLIAKYALDPKRKLSQRVSKATWRALTEQLGELEPAALDMFKPWFVATAVIDRAAQRIGLTREEGAEAIIVRAARETGKPIGELEGLDFQLKLLSGFSEPMQIAFLEASLTDAPKIGDVFPRMLAAWSAGNSEGLAALLNAEGNPEGFDKVLLGDRNARWANWIAARMARPGTVFIAVGAAHLGGPESVQTMLAKKGLKAELVQ